MTAASPSDAPTEHERFLASHPPRAALARLAADLQPGARVRRVRRLRGGIDASTHRVDAETPSGDRHSFVVRRFDVGMPWFRPDRFEREQAALAHAAAGGLPVPRVLLVDVDGEILGAPAIVLSLLPGRAIAPPGGVRWAGRLAGAAAAIHALAGHADVEGWLTDWLLDDRPPHYDGIDSADRLWPAIAAVRDDLRSQPRTFVHHDFHPGNTLWRRGALTGIVDWIHGGWGWPGYDVAFCQLDITLQLGAAEGDAFIEAYEGTAGSVGLLAGWQAIAALRVIGEVDEWLAAYRDLGMHSLTRETVHERVAAWIERALRDVGRGHR